jgi:hypothetical protein
MDEWTATSSIRILRGVLKKRASFSGKHVRSRKVSNVCERVLS